jgi:hypothetical protein
MKTKKQAPQAWVLPAGQGGKKTICHRTARIDGNFESNLRTASEVRARDIDLPEIAT